MADPGLWERAVHPDDIGWVLEVESACGLEGRELDIAYRIRRRDGELIWVRDRASAGTVDADGVMVVEGLITDISEQRAAEDRLRYLAEHDELTGLMNRRSFEAAVDEVLNSNRLPGERGAMVIIDLDHLKRVNDTLGRSTGDRVVADIAKMLGEGLGGDQILARLDSDEYGLLIPGRRRGSGARPRRQPTGDDPLADRHRQPDRERRRRARRARHGRQRNRPDHGRRHRAASGEGGRTRPRGHLHRRGPQQARVGRPRPPGRSRRAGSSSISQPIIDMASGLACAEELLVRMIDPVSGRPIAAGEFVPTAERFGLARNLDHWVVSQALELITAGRHVSANISAATISDQSPDRQGRCLAGEERRRPVAAHLRDHRDGRHPGDRVPARFHRPGRGARLRTLARRRRHRLRLAHLPPPPAVHRAEDRHAVRARRPRVERGPQDRRVAGRPRGASFGMRTVAEGVDNPALVEPLREIGVTCAQGYLFGRPSPALPTTA